MKKRAKDQSELLGLLNARKSWELPDEYRQPEIPEAAIIRAASVHARANDSDPFAYARIDLYLRAGFESPSDVIHDGNAALSRRSGEVRAQHKDLASLKRKLDEERAWNQHRAAMFVRKHGAA